MHIVNAEQMRKADAYAIEVLKTPSLDLMENAAAAVARVVQTRYQTRPVTLILAGKGNNGGDAMAVARILKLSGWDPHLLLVAEPESLKQDPAINWKRAEEAGVRMSSSLKLADIALHLEKAELVIDGLFGTGLMHPLKGIHEALVEAINQGLFDVVSIDVPSGLSSDSGEPIGAAIEADLTVALAALKYCHVFAPASEMCGEVYVADIGIPVVSDIIVTTSGEIRKHIPVRSSLSHKGTFGHALIIAGSTGKSGAAYLAGKAALRAGAGLVTVATPAAVQPLVAAFGPEIMTHPVQGNADQFSVECVDDLADLCRRMSSVAIGPGIGTSTSTLSFFEKLIGEIESPLIIDADGLNLLSYDLKMLLRRPAASTILTPHPGEMARLMKTDTNSVQNNRIELAKRLAKVTQSYVVLKGYRTIIVEPQGNVWVNPTGSPALASAGTGDVLTGVISGYLSQLRKPLEAALLGVYLHGFAGNFFESSYPDQALNATDILAFWHDVFATAVTEGTDIEAEYLKLHFEL